MMPNRVLFTAAKSILQYIKGMNTYEILYEVKKE